MCVVAFELFVCRTRRQFLFLIRFVFFKGRGGERLLWLCLKGDVL